MIFLLLGFSVLVGIYIFLNIFEMIILGVVKVGVYVVYVVRNVGLKLFLIVLYGLWLIFVGVMMMDCFYLVYLYMNDGRGLYVNILNFY